MYTKAMSSAKQKSESSIYRKDPPHETIPIHFPSDFIPANHHSL